MSGSLVTGLLAVSNYPTHAPAKQLAKARYFRALRPGYVHDGPAWVAAAGRGATFADRLKTPARGLGNLAGLCGARGIRRRFQAAVNYAQSVRAGQDALVDERLEQNGLQGKGGGRDALGGFIHGRIPLSAASPRASCLCPLTSATSLAGHLAQERGAYLSVHSSSHDHVGSSFPNHHDDRIRVA